MYGFKKGNTALLDAPPKPTNEPRPQSTADLSTDDLPDSVQGLHDCTCAECWHFIPSGKYDATGLVIGPETTEANHARRVCEFAINVGNYPEDQSHACRFFRPATSNFRD